MDERSWKIEDIEPLTPTQADAEIIALFHLADALVESDTRKTVEAKTTEAPT